MDWKEALKQMEEKKCLKRNDWGYPYHAYVELCDFLGEKCFVIIGVDGHNKRSRGIYHVTYADLKSSQWSIKTETQIFSKE